MASNEDNDPIPTTEEIDMMIQDTLEKLRREAIGLPAETEVDKIKRREQHKKFEAAKKEEKERIEKAMKVRRDQYEKDIESNTKQDHSDIKDIKNIVFGHASVQGFRPTMEDAMRVQQITYKNVKYNCYALFDGHGHESAAKLSAERLITHLSKRMHGTFEERPGHNREKLDKDPNNQKPFNHFDKNGDLDMNSCIEKAYEDMEDDLYLDLTDEYKNAGTTVVFVVHNTKTSDLFLANLGDSRIMLMNNHDSIFISKDHKPTEKSERKRIMDIGGTINFGRIHGQLAVSIALGDFNLKHRYANGDNAIEAHKYCNPTPAAYVSIVPDIAKYNLKELRKNNKNSEIYILLCCDGVVDMYPDDKLTELPDLLGDLMEDFNNKNIKKKEAGITSGLKYMAEEVVRTALVKGSTDNISALIIPLEEKWFI